MAERGIDAADAGYPEVNDGGTIDATKLAMNFGDGESFDVLDAFADEPSHAAAVRIGSLAKGELLKRGALGALGRCDDDAHFRGPPISWSREAHWW
jgi:hypothetical protein